MGWRRSKSRSHVHGSNQARCHYGLVEQGGGRVSPCIGVRPATDRRRSGELRRMSRQSKVFAIRQRAQIVLASDSQSTASEIARVLQTDENQVRRVIKDFNEMGMDFVRPRSGGGRPRRSTQRSVSGSVLSLSPVPQDLGEPFTRWSLTTLRRYLVRERIRRLGLREHLRRILNSLGITAQRTRTWKKSNDPYYEQKKSWVLSAYRGAEAGTIDGVVVCFDECGPISLKPHGGQGWFPKRKPGRQRATYRRTGGVRKSWVPTTSEQTGCGGSKRRDPSQDLSCSSS